MENGLFLQASARAKRPVFHVRAAIRKNQGQLSSLFPGQFRDPVDKSSAVFSQPCRRKENFLPFAQRSELLLSGRADRFWLVDRQPFQEPAVFLAAEVPYFRRIPRPLEPAIIQTFIIEAEPIFFLSEYSDKKGYPQPFVIRIFLPFILRYAHFPEKNMRIKIYDVSSF